MTRRKASEGASAPSISLEDVDAQTLATAVANFKGMLRYYESAEFKDGERLGRELLKIGDMPDVREAAKHLAAHPPTPLAIAWLVMEARRLGASATASGNASKRNQDLRAVVQEAWRNRADRAESKNSFAKQWSDLLRMQFRKTVTAETISDRWLKGL